ncbi:UDP-Glycosyltransferase/glycogen phosphorylase [Rhizodiscina lignyota]|uniref:UDP-Glycosyltransferase/glycogen phosphorylase n=1 Tax=Rhizodiscina lignyota TaxID=1504668 RepID=A0A9P4IGZ8_9PEZI|nr:UDP-Glycosyltransferase/glycogen phosphorylase [Rhizodiscina lignyota]
MSRLYTFLLVSVPALLIGIFFGPQLNRLNTQAASLLNTANNGERIISRSAKPPIIVGTISHWSHTEKFIQVGKGLIEKGYAVTFIGGPLFRDQIESIGATFEEVEGSPTTPGYQLSDELMAELAKMDVLAPETAIFLWGNMFLKSIPKSFRALQRTLKRLDDARTIFIHDVMFFAATPLFRGAAGLRPHTTMAIGVVPASFESNDTMPYNSGLLPHTGPDAHNIHWQAQLEADKHPIWSGLNAMIDEVFAEMGAAPPGMRASTAMGSLADIYCPMTIPEFDFTRSDSKVETVFIGMPKTPGLPNRELPPWWEDILQAKKEGKKVIAVSRSSFDVSLENTILPALEGLKSRTDLVVVVALVNSEVGDFKAEHDIPSNAYITRLIPFDLLFPHVDVLVTSAGYGTIQNALRHGVPVLSHGELEDKPQIGALIQHTGVGVFYQHANLDAQTVSDSVDKLLGNSSYLHTARKIQDIYKDYDPIDKLDQLIQERMKAFEEL